MNLTQHPMRIGALMLTLALTACQTSTPSPNVTEAKSLPGNRPQPMSAPMYGMIGQENLGGYAPTIAPSSTDKYAKITDNAVQQTSAQPVSTFSLDVDTSSYANTRRFLTQGQMPPPDAVRVEELLNYFPSQSSKATQLNNAPFSVDYEITRAPWDDGKALLRLNVQAVGVNEKTAPASHLTFLVDVSGSMQSSDKLGLVQKSLKILVAKLRPQDTVSLVTYAGATAVVLEPTSGKDKLKIEQAIDQLSAGGGTAGGAGLALAYKMAEQNFIKGDINRILLATDGDFNLGVSSIEELKSMVKREREKGITLSTLGFGTGNYNDEMMEQIADAGNGNSSYIDSMHEAEKVLGDEMGSTLITVAKDVKAQIEFNPARVQEWRQIGYENRQLKREDFNNDAVDAGDIGSGKRVTILYELVLTGQKTSIDPLRYQNEKNTSAPSSVNANKNELAFLKMRWKAPEGKTSQLAKIAIQAPRQITAFEQAGNETRFMGAVAAFGQKLRNNPAVQNTSWQDIGTWVQNSRGDDPAGYRSEFARLIKDAERLAK